jgi:HemY protein
MIRFAFGAVVLLVIGFAAAWLASHSGVLALEIADLRIETTVVTATVATGLLILVSVVLHHMWRWLWRSPGSFGASRAARQRRDGYLSLTRGMVAVAAGDVAEAQRHATQAAKRLHEPHLTLLLSAQVAQLAGDEAAAERHFTAMLKRAETEFLGLRGLLAQAVRKGDRDKALTLAERARAIRPNTPWLLRELFALQTAGGQWAAAEATLVDAMKAKALPAEESQHSRAVLIYQRAQAAAGGEPTKLALKLAEQALELAPEFVPAAILVARLQQTRGKPRKAARVLIDAWTRAPHPELADAYLALYADLDKVAQLARLDDLVAGQPEHMESRLALARAALAAGDYPRTRRELEPLIADRTEGAVSQRAARLMAELEEKQYGDGLSAREWLLRAASAPADHAWSCRSCGWRGATWTIQCAACGGFDTLRWRAPATGTQVLAITPPPS